MRRLRKAISSILLMAMFLSIICNNGYAAARAVAIPTPVVTGLNASYMLGSELKLKLTATGTTKLVQFKAVLKNETTGQVTNVINGYTAKYYNPKTGYPLNIKINAGGKYTLSVTAKPGGYKESYAKTITKTFMVISNGEVINSILPVTARVNIGDTYTLPVKVEAKMKDGSARSVDVKWDSTLVNTSEVGTKTYYGTVAQYNQKVQLTLNVVDEKIVSIEELFVTIDEGAQFQLPQKVTAKLSNNTMEIGVTWDKTNIDTSIIGKQVITGRVQGYDKAVTLTLTVNAVEAKLTSVYTQNLKELVAVFNKSILMNTVRNNNFRLYRGSAQIAANVELRDDGKSVAIALAQSGTAFDIREKYTLVVEGVKDSNGSIIQKASMEFTPQDNEAPIVKSIGIKSANSLVIEFSEPIKYTGAGVVEVRNSNRIVPLKGNYSGFDTNEITVSFSYPMTMTAKYDIVVKNFQDYSGKVCIQKNESFTYIKSDKPIEAKLKYADEAYAVIDFSDYVTGVSRYNFSNIALGNYSLGVYKNKEMTSPVSITDSIKRVWVKFYDRSSRTGYPFTEVEQKLIFRGSYNGSTVKDIWSTTAKDAIFPVKVAVDDKLPSIISITPTSESVIEIVFDEDVRLTLANIDILDNTGKKIPGYKVNQGSEGKYNIDLMKNYAGSNLILNIKNVEDLAIKPNKLSAYTKTLLITDRTPPKVEKVVKKFVAGLEQAIYVYFNEPVNAEAIESFRFSLQNPSSNIMEKLSLKPSLTNRDSVIMIPLTDAERNKVEGGSSIFISNIEDKSKNILEGQIISSSSITAYNSIDNKPKVEKLEAIGNNKLVVTFNQYLNIVNESAFFINGYTPQAVELSTNASGNTVATLITQAGRELNSDLNGAYLRIATDNNVKLENEFGVDADAAIYTSTSKPGIIERMPPVLKGVNTILSSVGKVDAIVVEYTENIDATKLSALTYSVDGRQVSRVYTCASPNRGAQALGRFVIIELKADTSGAITGNPQVIQVLDIYDMNDNKLAPTGEVILN